MSLGSQVTPRLPMTPAPKPSTTSLSASSVHISGQMITQKWEKIFAQETGTDAEATKINTRSTRLQIPLDQKVIDSQNDLIGASERADVLPDVFDFADQVDVRFED
ncbi:hypothetical protein [Corynebacterium stationis]|uniref:hypothetical protein n=1 Tax=Corynebacterium stationis TaxID=1705 RepID=UPI001FD60515|nr:hypothetical protein [Corynebacterium stationis]